MQPLATFLQKRAAARRELELRRARKDFASFAEFIFGVRLADFHRRWCADAETHPRLVGFAPVEHGKSTLLNVGLLLWTLGNNPDARCATIMATSTQAARIAAAVSEHILRNDRLHAVFPKLKPATGARTKWSDTELLVDRPSLSKDPSLIALGVGGPLIGARLDLAIVDDVLDFSSTLTEAQRTKTIGWFLSTLVGRVVDRGRIVVIGTPWHTGDLLHHLERSGEYHAFRDAAITANGKPLWPEQWRSERLAQRRREIGEVEFSRQFLVQAIADGTSRFSAESIEHAFDIARKQGAMLATHYAGPYPTFTGVDLGIGRSDHHDQSVIFTIVLLPNGARQVIDIDSGRWSAAEIVERIKSVRQRFGSVVRVESNAAQSYLVQFCESAGVHVEAHTTGRDKHHAVYGIEGMAVELEKGMWIVPDAPATRAWARELLVYNPAAHAGDALMASWLAREAARCNDGGAPIGPVAGVSTFEDVDDEDEGDPAAWVLGSSKPSLPLLRYRGLRDRGIPIGTGGGGARRPTYRVR